MSKRISNGKERPGSPRFLQNELFSKFQSAMQKPDKKKLTKTLGKNEIVFHNRLETEPSRAHTPLTRSPSLSDVGFSTKEEKKIVFHKRGSAMEITPPKMRLSGPVATNVETVLPE